MNAAYLDQVTQADCRRCLPALETASVDLFLSDIPYGINLDDWDVLHHNTNAALLGSSPAQLGKSGFRRRGKPINGWNAADRHMGQEYEAWCSSWAPLLFPVMKAGAPLLVFGARRTLHRVINAFEKAGFLLRDVLAWKKPAAHHRAQRLSTVLERRGLHAEAADWTGWRLGNLAPAYEPIAWFFKPYSQTLTDNVLTHGLGAIHTDACQIEGSSPGNLLSFGYQRDEQRVHEAQKPLALIEFLIRLTTREGQVVLDPFLGSGTTAVAAQRLQRHFIGFEIDPAHCAQAQQRLATVT